MDSVLEKLRMPESQGWLLVGTRQVFVGNLHSERLCLLSLGAVREGSDRGIV